jgi:prepilin-type N-terminal cleavage/methylation domain-containing protein
MTIQIHRGFSLIELMVALAIAATLLLFAMPAYTLWLADSQIRNGAQLVADGLRWSQAEAIKRNEPVQTVIDMTTQTGGWSAQRASDALVLQVGTFNDADRVIFTPTPLGAATVTFDGLGRVPAANADASDPVTSVDITSALAGTHALRVVVGGSVTGVKICDPAFVSPDPKACP